MDAMAAEGWVLAGGLSRRMGRDKAALHVAGISMLQRMLRKFAVLGLASRVAGLRNARAGIAVTAFEDAHPGCGPLSGIETALRHGNAPLILIVSVDLPLISTMFLANLLERATMTEALATMPRLLGDAQPLCAVYRRPLLEPVSHALESGEFKVLRAVERGASALGGKVDLFDAERLATADMGSASCPMHWQLLNCNTPEDLALAETLLARDPML